MPYWPDAIGRIALTISAIAEMQLGFLCIRPDGRRRLSALDEISLHTEYAYQNTQLRISAHGFGVRRLFSRGDRGLVNANQGIISTTRGLVP